MGLFLRLSSCRDRLVMQSSAQEPMIIDLDDPAPRWFRYVAVAGALIIVALLVLPWTIDFEPADDATVLTILGEGVELDVTGSPADGWIPVIDPASGQAGFVSDQFVAIAS